MGSAPPRAELERLARLLQAQQGQLAVLSSRLSGLHDEHEALRECLTASGTVTEDRLLARLHRQRFTTAVRRHPFLCHESLETIARAKELLVMVMARSGLDGVGALDMTSRSLHHSVASTIPELTSLFPVSLYAIGGEAGQAALASVERLDPLAGRWTPCPPLSAPRSGCAAVAVGEHVYVVGGCSADGEDLNTVERLVVHEGYWEAAPPMTAGRDELAVARVCGLVCAIGGSHLVWPVRHVIDTAEYLCPSDETWQPLPKLDQERCAAAAAGVGSRVYVLGGCDEDGTALASAESYDVGAEAWRPLAPMRRPRCNFAAAVSGGCIIVAGGYDDRMRDHDTVESLDPTRPSAWESISVLAVPRWGVRAVGRAGAIYVVGGHTRDGEVGSAGRLDPATGSWTSLAPLRAPRRSFGLAAVRG